VVVNVFGLSVWNFLHVTILAPRILKWLLRFWVICAALFFTAVYSDRDLYRDADEIMRYRNPENVTVSLSVIVASLSRSSNCCFSVSDT
jgi:hypothetical protein